MRTTSAAATNVASGDGNNNNGQEVFWDPLFRDAKGRVVEAPSLGAPVADTHTHLDMLHNPSLALARSAAHGVDFIVTVVDPTEDSFFTLDNLEAWQDEAHQLLTTWSLEAGQQEGGGHTLPPSTPLLLPPHVRIIAGCHPHNASKYNSTIEQVLLETLLDPHAAGIGEIGLDYHYDLSPRDVQQRVFRRQIQLAHEHAKPIALHLREAHPDGLRILREEGLPAAGTLLHCFNLDYATLEPFLELGCMVAYGGPLTFKKSSDVRDAARRTPLDRIVTETDAPFMAPHPLRGTVCGPEHTVFTTAKLLEVFEVADKNAPDFCRKLHQNALDFFNRATNRE
jgi:TatD DNase family protein